jgi:hypothetical protein
MRKISHVRRLIEKASLLLSFLLAMAFFGLGLLLGLYELRNFRRGLSSKLLLIGECFLTPLGLPKPRQRGS